MPNTIQGHLMNKTLLGSRMAVNFLVENAVEKLTLRAFVGVDAGTSIGDNPVWIGWHSGSMAILHE